MAAQFDSTYHMITHIQRLVEHEKASVARELHDEVGGCLIGAVMDLALLAPRIAGLGEDSQTKLTRVRESLGSAIMLTRRITEQLRPTLLDNVGLFAALRWQLNNSCTKFKVKCTEDLPAIEPRLTSGASIALFRSVQEALLVGLERDGVTAIALVGTVDDKALSIQVMGDGAHLVDEPSHLGNVTLASVRHRIQVLGGIANVDRPPNGGIVVEVSAPIANVVAPC